jgi:hypothetical protein
MTDSLLRATVTEAERERRLALCRAFLAWNGSENHDAPVPIVQAEETCELAIAQAVELATLRAWKERMEKLATPAEHTVQMLKAAEASLSAATARERRLREALEELVPILQQQLDRFLQNCGDQAEAVFKSNAYQTALGRLERARAALQATRTTEPSDG